MSFSFRTDGSLDVSVRLRRDHLPVLEALSELPFGLGKNLLSDHLRGLRHAKSAKLKLDSYNSFGLLGGYGADELSDLLFAVIGLGLVEYKKSGVYSVLSLTEKGSLELSCPSLSVDIRSLSGVHDSSVALDNPFSVSTAITDDDKALFAALKNFFPRFNDEQRKAVVCDHLKVLCVAGAGSGKTSVLTKRVEFLVKYRSVSPDRILAITFTRKAAREMKLRLSVLLPGVHVRVETFNSFCEKFLREHGDGAESLLSFSEFLDLLGSLLVKSGVSKSALVRKYFSSRQAASKDDRSLFFSFSYDFQLLVERYKLGRTSLEALRSRIAKNHMHADMARLMLDLLEGYVSSMKEAKRRDFSDQLLSALALMKSSPSLVPVFDHVLVDEFQDVNDVQVELLDVLCPKNMFVVGDPRQSIYGWRGSRLSHILDFSQRDCEIVQLTKNYRSSQAIIDVCNALSAKMSYPPLECCVNSKGLFDLKRFSSEDEQASFVTRKILSYTGHRKDIFVLCRTNKGLNKLREFFDASKISYLLRTDELKKPSVEAGVHDVTLATVHAIKGLQAKLVFVINANSSNFPSKSSDHPVLELFSLGGDYDSFSEELRVLYVALSRAQEELIITYTGSLTPFLPKKFSEGSLKKTDRVPRDALAAMMKLRAWRYSLARQKSCPAYVICSDRTLEELLDKLPSTLEELYTVRGLGKKRIEDFGEDLLSVLFRL